MTIGYLTIFIVKLNFLLFKAFIVLSLSCWYMCWEDQDLSSSAWKVWALDLSPSQAPIYSCLSLLGAISTKGFRLDHSCQLTWASYDYPLAKRPQKLLFVFYKWALNHSPFFLIFTSEEHSLSKHFVAELPKERVQWNEITKSIHDVWGLI